MRSSSPEDRPDGKRGDIMASGGCRTTSSMACFTSSVPEMSLGVSPWEFLSSVQSGSMPASSRATSACPARAATCRGVSMTVSWKASRCSMLAGVSPPSAARLAPAWMACSSTRTTSTWPRCAAMCSAVQRRRTASMKQCRTGRLSPKIRRSTRAPSRSSRWQMSTWPLAAARKRGVFPSMSNMLTFKPIAALWLNSRIADLSATPQPRSQAEKMSAVA
mmetsp:Transcript_21771/g.61821  ORF Transcript_21771/g.61821 Transcript_21771/m.61821 type:complete len:219 (-) Transcript_21771:1222-1878(-)